MPRKKPASRTDPNKCATAAAVIKTDQRAAEILKCRVERLTYAEIAERFGISTSTAHAIVTRECRIIGQTLNETRLEALQLELAALDELQNSHRGAATTWLKVVKHIKGEDVVVDVPPDAESARVMIQCMERRAKLLGMDKPAQLEVNVQVQVTQLAEAQTGAFPLVIERLEREGWTPEQLERAAYAISLMQETAGERLKALDAAPVVETDFEEVKGDG